MSVMFSARVPEWLATAVDEACEGAGETRTEFVCRALEAELDLPPGERRFDDEPADAA